MAITTPDSGGVLVPSASSMSDLQLFRMPRGGTDRLRFETWDTFRVKGFDEPATVHLEGHYMIERADPTSADWVTGSVDIRMRELLVEGVSDQFGRVRATVNDAMGYQSGGRVLAGTAYDSKPDEPKMCEMDGFMMFELPDVGLTLFNREAIPLRHTITHIPPIGQGGGTPSDAAFAGIPLYDRDNPDGEPLATLLRVKTHIGAWLASAA
jgi:hypothetical protein